jgi:hypothetical protein
MNILGKEIANADVKAEIERLVQEKQNLSGANLSGANLSGANLYGADLRGANLYGANLYGANLYGAYLSGADLSGADLRGADLRGADLSGAYLSGANLYGAYLSGANLSRANLRGADLRGADLSGIILSPIDEARLTIVPESGSITGWKKCRSGVIVKVEIPDGTRRSNSTGRKCRAERVKVIEIIGGEVGISLWDEKTEYRIGEIVECHEWDENRWNECSGGIHFFLTKIEAEVFEL